jgi:hypothetical protein
VKDLSKAELEGFDLFWYQAQGLRWAFQGDLEERHSVYLSLQYYIKHLQELTEDQKNHISKHPE